MTVVWATPANAGFDRSAIVARLRELRADGHDHDFIDGDGLGSGVAALFVLEDGQPVDIYPHQVGDGYETIGAYFDAL